MSGTRLEKNLMLLDIAVLLQKPKFGVNIIIGNGTNSIRGLLNMSKYLIGDGIFIIKEEMTE